MLDYGGHSEFIWAFTAVLVAMPIFLRLAPEERLFRSVLPRIPVVEGGLEAHPTEDLVPAEAAPGQVAGDPEEPALELTFRAVAARVPVDAEKGLLAEVLRLLRGAEHPVEEGEDGALPPLDEGAEGRLVAFRRSRHEFVIVHRSVRRLRFRRAAPVGPPGIVLYR